MTGIEPACPSKGTEAINLGVGRLN